mgnify:CR=1 FL=1|jgi:hypothetical protein
MRRGSPVPETAEDLIVASVREHWDDTYRTKAETRVSWYQPDPERSRALIETAAPARSAGIIDVGGGASRLVDGLLADGYGDLTVLDVSAVALDRSRARLGSGAEAVQWIVADVTRWRPSRTWDVWHDRAVFHFLVDEPGRDAYLAALTQATRAGSAVVIATFAPAGPERCSGLPVQRYDAASLAARLGPDFELVSETAEAHVTPAGAIQAFQYAVFRRR